MEDSPSAPRSKRQKIDKGGRFAAFEKLKQLKGSKHKLELDAGVDNVYDTVEEKEYEKIVLARADSDWIEDDGTGYVEDGREIFDEDVDEPRDNSRAGTSSSSSSKEAKGAKKRLRDINAPVNDKSNIKKMFSNAAAQKQKQATPKLVEDDILTDILGEIDINNVDIRPGPITAVRRSSKERHEKKLVHQFMQEFTKPPAVVEKDAQEDDALIEEMFKQNKAKPKQPTPSTSVDKQTAPPRSTAAALAPPAAVPAPSVDIQAPPSSATNDDEELANIDYSMLLDDTDDNQFQSTRSTAAKAEPSSTDDSNAYEHIFQNWVNTCNGMTDPADNADAVAAAAVDTTTIGDESSVRFWLWDAWEDAAKRPGQIFLFGKIAAPGKPAGEYVTACIKVEHIDRCLYLLPREYILDNITKRPTRRAVTFNDIYEEFVATISTAVGVTEFRSKFVPKNFAFTEPAGVHVPATCDYFQVRYDGTRPAPNKHVKYNTVAHIFGTATTALETFLLDHKIKGPCWLNIAKAAHNAVPLSWCKVELTCSDSRDNVTVCTAADTPKVALAPPPPLVLTTLNVKTALNAKTNKNEVVMIAVLVNKAFAINKPAPSTPFEEHFCGFTRPLAHSWPLDLATKLAQFRPTKATKLESERALLSWFLANFQRIDPDLVVIHDANDCQLDVICDRLAALKLPFWSRIGRLRMTQLHAHKRFAKFFAGRMICDVKLSAEELIKSRSYDLDTLCRVVLKTTETDRRDVSNEDLHEMYETSDGIIRLITLTMHDASYVLRLMCELNVLPLALQITNICGNLMGRTLQGGRSERNEYLLLHAFTDKNYIMPDKQVREWDTQHQVLDATQQQQQQPGGGTQGRKKPQYAGGLVLDPIKGFYDKFVLLMDFNSLYPSIIQEYNICFTTIDTPKGSLATFDGGEEMGEDLLPDLPDSSVEQGVLPHQIRRLVESRREVKKLMANPDCDPELKQQYDIRQTALKLTANSMYGCLGFTYSRFFAQHLAALVTFKGREILTNTKALVQKLNYSVIYGDTDSIMINTNSIDYDEVFKVGKTIKAAVNKMYRQVELDIDGVFKYLLLLKKKKYAAVTISRERKTGELVCKQEHKGLDIVRRDWSQISVTAGTLVLDELLSDVPMDDRLANIHKHLERLRDTILNGSVPESLLAITKQLTKAPKDYGATTNLPHVQVALRMNETRNKRFKRGDMIPYVICDDGTDRPATQRAYHLDELKASADTLKIDTNYYLASQIHPVVSRLIEPIEGTDPSRIAGYLGLDASKFKGAASRVQRERAEHSLGEAIVKTTAQKFRDCERFTFKCRACRTDNLVASAFRRNDQQQLVAVLGACANPACAQAPMQYVAAIRNQLVLAMRKPIQRFYENWLVCDDTDCSNNTRLLTHVLINNRPACLVCKTGSLHRQYTERDLFNQLSYFQYVFDLSKHETLSAKLSPELHAAYATLKEAVDAVIGRSAFGVVKLGALLPPAPPEVTK